MNIEHPTSNTQHPSKTRNVLWLMGALALLAVGFVIVSAQQNSAPGLVKGFNITRYHPTPNHRQIEFKLVGTEARQLTGPTRQFQITQPNFQAFQTNGVPLVRIESPECLFDEASRTLSSTETLSMQSGDGRFSLTGTGFRWRQDDKVLVISNDVRAVIFWTNNAPPLEITSRWFEFNAETRRGVFHNDVRGENPEQVFTCETLTITGNLESTNREPLELIEADGGLEITRKIGTGFAKAERGTYRPAEERVQLLGAAEWKWDEYSGRADRMTAWLNSTNVEASGNVQLRLPRGTLGAAGGLLGATNATAKSSATNLVVLTADQFSKRGPQLLAEGSVRVSDGTNQLTCDRLEGQQSPHEFAVATGNVFVGREAGGIYSDRADYTHTNHLVLFTGNPQLIQGEIRGTATRILVRTLTSEVFAQENVQVTFPVAAADKSVLDVLPNFATNRVSRPALTNQLAQVTARQFLLRDRQALFSGGVIARQLSVTGGEPRLQCEELEIQFAPDGKRPESLQARENVVVENGVPGVVTGAAETAYSRMESARLLARTNPQTGELVDLTAAGGVDLVQADTRARGDRMVFTAADQVLKLIGQPSVRRPEVTYSSDEELIWDIARQKVIGSNYRINVNPDAETLKRLEESQKLR
jgi:lipopolysaccharide export system protein LptA